MPDSEQHGALTEAVYYILLSLFTPLHGYGIMQKVKMMSDGRVDLGAGTLYGAINTLLQRGWIEPHQTDKASRRKEYLATDLGRKAVRTEIVRLKELVRNGEEITGGENR